MIAAGARTPIGKLNGALAKVDAVELGRARGPRRAGAHRPRARLRGRRQRAAGRQRAEPGPPGGAPGRRRAHRPGITLNDVCLASMSAVGVAAAMMRAEEATTVLVGGFDSMTRAPHALRLRPGDRRWATRPMIDVMVHDGLYCSIADEGMGGMSDAENARLGITREAQDEFAARSHARARRRRGAAGRGDRAGRRAARTTRACARRATRRSPRSSPPSPRTARSPPATPPRSPTAPRRRVITTADRAAGPAGRGRRPRGRRRAGLDAAPAPRRGVARSCSHRHGLKPADIALWEINEAFAGVVLASATRAGDRPRARERQRRRGRARPPARRLRPAARPHARLRAAPPRRRLGVATLCGGGGQGEAILLKRCSDVLVIGAGPYGLAAAKALRDRGLSTAIVGRPMGFWRDHMPAGMLLRSGPDWHLDHARASSRFERSSRRDPPDPIPLELFLDYADWFQSAGRDRGDRGRAPAAARAAPRPPPGESRPAGRRRARHRVLHPPAGVGDRRASTPATSSTSRTSPAPSVLIVGGRQSAYEWAALLSSTAPRASTSSTATPQPRFADVSWGFVDPHDRATRSRTRGWWRTLPQSERDAIARRFWEVGRLTLEHWLEPRIAARPRPRRAEVVTPTGRSTQRRHHVCTRTGSSSPPATRPTWAASRTCRRSIATATVPGARRAHAVARPPGLYLPGFTATAGLRPVLRLRERRPGRRDASSRVTQSLEAHTNG